MFARRTRNESPAGGHQSRWKAGGHVHTEAQQPASSLGGDSDRTMPPPPPADPSYPSPSSPAPQTTAPSSPFPAGHLTPSQRFASSSRSLGPTSPQEPVQPLRNVSVGYHQHPTRNAGGFAPQDPNPQGIVRASTKPTAGAVPLPPAPKANSSTKRGFFSSFRREDKRTAAALASATDTPTPLTSGPRPLELSARRLRHDSLNLLSNGAPSPRIKADQLPASPIEASTPSLPFSPDPPGPVPRRRDEGDVSRPRRPSERPKSWMALAGMEDEAGPPQKFGQPAPVPSSSLAGPEDPFARGSLVMASSSSTRPRQLPLDAQNPGAMMGEQTDEGAEVPNPPMRARSPPFFDTNAVSSPATSDDEHGLPNPQISQNLGSNSRGRSAFGAISVAPRNLNQVLGGYIAPPSTTSSNPASSSSPAVSQRQNGSDAHYTPPQLAQPFSSTSQAPPPAASASPLSGAASTMKSAATSGASGYSPLAAFLGQSPSTGNASALSPLGAPLLPSSPSITSPTAVATNPLSTPTARPQAQLSATPAMASSSRLSMLLGRGASGRPTSAIPGSLPPQNNASDAPETPSAASAERHANGEEAEAALHAHQGTAPDRARVVSGATTESDLDVLDAYGSNSAISANASPQATQIGTSIDKVKPPPSQATVAPQALSPTVPGDRSKQLLESPSLPPATPSVAKAKQAVTGPPTEKPGPQTSRLQSQAHSARTAASGAKRPSPQIQSRASGQSPAVPHPASPPPKMHLALESTREAPVAAEAAQKRLNEGKASALSPKGSSPAARASGIPLPVSKPKENRTQRSMSTSSGSTVATSSSDHSRKGREVDSALSSPITDDSPHPRKQPFLPITNAVPEEASAEDAAHDEAEEDPSEEEPLCRGKPRFEYALLAFPHTILIGVLCHLEYLDFHALPQLSRPLRRGLNAGDPREVVMDRYIGDLGYRIIPVLPPPEASEGQSRQPGRGLRATSANPQFASQQLPRGAKLGAQSRSATDKTFFSSANGIHSDGVEITLRDLHAYYVGLEFAAGEPAALARQLKREGLDLPTVRMLRASTRAHNKILARIRTQPAYLVDQSRRLMPSAVDYLGNAIPPPPPIYKLGRAALMKVWVPTKQSWMSDEELVECEREVWRSGTWAHVKRGDVVLNTAVGDFGNEGKLIHDGKYLRDLSYLYDAVGHVPSWLNMLTVSPAFYHNIIASSTNHPVVYLDLTTFGQQVQETLALCQDKVDVASPQGRYRVQRWVYRAVINIKPGMMVGGSGGVGGGGPGGIEVIHADWAGRCVIEADGTSEHAKDVLNRCTKTAHKDQVPTHRMTSQQAVQAKEKAKQAQLTPWRILRERSRPGHLWIRPVYEDERI